MTAFCLHCALVGRDHDGPCRIHPGRDRLPHARRGHSLMTKWPSNAWRVNGDGTRYQPFGRRSWSDPKQCRCSLGLTGCGEPIDGEDLLCAGCRVVHRAQIDTAAPNGDYEYRGR
jgi:hypothetical protein